MQREEEILSCYFSFFFTVHLLLNLQKTSPIEEIGNAWGSSLDLLKVEASLTEIPDGKSLQVLPNLY